MRPRVMMTYRGHEKPLPIPTYVYVVHIQQFILYFIFNYFLQESTCKMEPPFLQSHYFTNIPVIEAKYFCKSLKCVSPFTICFFSNCQNMEITGDKGKFCEMPDCAV